VVLTINTVLDWADVAMEQDHPASIDTYLMCVYVFVCVCVFCVGGCQDYSLGYALMFPDTSQ